jgi:uncharacterized protein with HEPN domain
MKDGPPLDRLSEWLLHMVDACERIDRYCAGLDEAGFVADDLRHNAVLRMLEVLGEAAQRVLRGHPEFVTQNPHLPLTSAYQLRNAIAHGYEKVDLTIIWRTVMVDLPLLRQQLLALRQA